MWGCWKASGIGNQIDKEGEPVLALDGLVLCLEPARVAQTAADGQTQEEKTEASDDHGGDVDGDREGVHLLVEDVGREEGQQRQAEEEAQVGVEDQLVGLFGAVDEVVMIDPVDADEGKGDEIEAQRGENGAEAGEAVLVGDLQLEHHDGDDDGDDSVGEGFEAGLESDRRGDPWLLVWQKHTTAIAAMRSFGIALELAHGLTIPLCRTCNRTR